MGSSGSRLRNVLASGDLEGLQEAIQHPVCTDMLNRPLNRRGDTALSFALRHDQHQLVAPLLRAGSSINSINRDGDTPLDVLLRQVLPPDDSILHDHFCPFTQCDDHDFSIPAVVLTLIRAGACARTLQRLVMHLMKDSKAIGQLCEIITDLETDRHFRVSGLLLQVSVWFQQEDNLRTLLRRGVNPVNFWQAVFLPEVVPTANPLMTWAFFREDDNDTGEYSLPLPTEESGDAEGVQSLKFSFVQDWRADWSDGDNPAAQYRAALQLTPEAACLFAKAAHCYTLLCHIMADVMAYLPPLCDGPNLKDSPVLHCLAQAGYIFSEHEMRKISLTFGVDFSEYIKLRYHPKSLKHLCRLTIRFNLNSNVFHALQQLDFLPLPIKQYISMDDIEMI